MNSDVIAAPGVEIVADIRQGLPLADDCFDYIVSIHALPELAYRELDGALRELHCVLRPGGTRWLGLPDMDKAIHAYRTGGLDYFLIGDEVVRSLAGKMIVQLTWFGQSRSMFTFAFIHELLERNQFRQVRACGYRQTYSPYPGIVELDDRLLKSFFVEAEK